MKSKKLLAFCVTFLLLLVATGCSDKRLIPNRTLDHDFCEITNILANEGLLAEKKQVSIKKIKADQAKLASLQKALDAKNSLTSYPKDLSVLANNSYKYLTLLRKKELKADIKKQYHRSIFLAVRISRNYRVSNKGLKRATAIDLAHGYSLKSLGLSPYDAHHTKQLEGDKEKQISKNRKNSKNAKVHKTEMLIIIVSIIIIFFVFLQPSKQDGLQDVISASNGGHAFLDFKNGGHQLLLSCGTIIFFALDILVILLLEGCQKR